MAEATRLNLVVGTAVQVTPQTEPSSGFETWGRYLDRDELHTLRAAVATAEHLKERLKAATRPVSRKPLHDREMTVKVDIEEPHILLDLVLVQGPKGSELLREFVELQTVYRARLGKTLDEAPPHVMDGVFRGRLLEAVNATAGCGAARGARRG